MKKILLFFAILFATAFGYTAQAVESHTVACTAGNLANLASSYLTTVTNLTVTGTVDARDFKTMRDAMPLLKVIDLSGSTVSAYTGTEGTEETTSVSYTENGIPAYAFYNPSTFVGKYSLETFIFPSSVTRIGESAFNTCYGLSGSLTIPSSVTTINSRAFYYCNNITSIYVSTSTPIDISSSVDVFSGINCKIYVPANSKALYVVAPQWKDLYFVEELSQTAVCVAGNLANVAASYLSTVTNLTVTGTIDARDFKTMRDNMPLLSVIDLSGCSVSAYNGTEGTSGTVTTDYPANEIPVYAFYNESNNTSKMIMKSFIYPLSVTTIGYSAFYSCRGLTGPLTLPSSVSTIGLGAFYECSGFTGPLIIPSSVTNIGSIAFYGCTGFTGSLAIPSSVTAIGNSAFYGCSNFTGSLTLPSSLTRIEAYAFYGCSGITGPLTIPSSVIAIDRFAFDGCSGFTGSLTIPSSVIAIGASAFEYCSGFTGSLTIPSSVTKIGLRAFNGCNGINSIYAYSSMPINISGSSNVFYDVNKTTCILHVPVGSKGLYAAANQWKDFTNIVEGFPTSLNEVSNNSITLYPNPASSTITVSELSSLVSDKAITLSITDISGNTILTKCIEPTLNSATVDVSSLSSGAYVMVIQSSNGNVVKRFLKR